MAGDRGRGGTPMPLIRRQVNISTDVKKPQGKMTNLEAPTKEYFNDYKETHAGSTD